MLEYLKLPYNLSSLLYKHLNSSYLDVDAIDFFSKNLFNASSISWSNAFTINLMEFLPERLL